jgi:hypothetical protein
MVVPPLSEEPLPHAVILIRSRLQALCATEHASAVRAHRGICSRTRSQPAALCSQQSRRHAAAPQAGRMRCVMVLSRPVVAGVSAGAPRWPMHALLGRLPIEDPLAPPGTPGAHLRSLTYKVVQKLVLCSLHYRNGIPLSFQEIEKIRVLLDRIKS